MIAMKSRRCLRIALFTGSPPQRVRTRGRSRGRSGRHDRIRKRRGGRRDVAGRRRGRPCLRPVDVGERLAIARRVELVRRRARRVHRARAERLVSSRCRRRLSRRLSIAVVDGLRPAAEAGADGAPVAVEARALTGEADHAVPELLVVLDDRAVAAPRRERAVSDADVAGRDDRVREAAIRLVELRQELQRLALELCEVLRRRLERVEQTAQLVLPQQRARLGDPWEGGLHGRRRLQHRRREVAREAARRRERSVQALEGGVGGRRASGRASRPPASARVLCDANAPAVVLKLTISSCSARSLGRSVVVRRAIAAIMRERSCGSVPSSALLTSALPLNASGA